MVDTHLDIEFVMNNRPLNYEDEVEYDIQLPVLIPNALIQGTNILNLQKQPPDVFHKKAVLKKCAIFAKKHLCWNLIIIKLQA